MNDKANTRLINVGVVLVVVIALAGIIVLTLADKPVPDVISGALLLGLGALTAHSSTRPTTPAVPAPATIGVTGGETAEPSEPIGTAVVVGKLK